MHLSLNNGFDHHTFVWVPEVVRCQWDQY